jgi:hypothetical protein
MLFIPSSPRRYLDMPSILKDPVKKSCHYWGIGKILFGI